VRQVVSARRRGAGPRPAAARIRRTVPVPIRWPRPSSSPWIRRWPLSGARTAPPGLTCGVSIRSSGVITVDDRTARNRVAMDRAAERRMKTLAT